jgi:hypothetical protein
MFSEITLHRPVSLDASGPEGLETKYHSIQFNSIHLVSGSQQYSITSQQTSILTYTPIQTSKHTVSFKRTYNQNSI